MAGLRGVAARLGATLLAGLSLAVAAPTASAQTVAPEQCPDTAVLAARGSEQNNGLVPRRYAPESPWVSNGFEARHISQFLDYAQARHREQTGESLLANVPVIALDDSVYPAALPVPADLAEHHLPDVVDYALSEFLASLGAGIRYTSDFVNDWEAATGCTPDYILIGYSQGALVLNSQEERLAEEGRLRGALYLGNPLLQEEDPSIVGNHETAGGVLKSIPADWHQTAWEAPRMNYCLDGDLICDTSDKAAGISRSTPGTDHVSYFNGPNFSEADAHVADTFAGWVTGGAES